MKEKAAQFILQKLANATAVMLLYVLYSEGSSPGRQGFHMVVAKDGELFGSIGGGIMEHKLVEVARHKLTKEEKTVAIKPQYHDKAHSTDRSGMICSGHQIVAFLPLYQSDIPIVESINKALSASSAARLLLSPNGTAIVENDDSAYQPGFHQKNETDWYYATLLNKRKTIHIFGGGHVSLALSEVMRFLGFYIKIYEDRRDLNTLEQNTFCHEKHIQPYDSIGRLLENSEEDYVVIMTFGYRPDKVILLQLLEKTFFYIGLMGSEAKIRALLDELAALGYSPSAYQHIFTPIGLDINSKTPQEIAISIAAEIIKETNRL